MPTATSRTIVRDGIAQFFGGTTFDNTVRAYRGSGPLLSNGLSSVRPYVPKRISDTEFVWDQAAGRGMGASMQIGLSDDTDRRRAVPVITGKRRIAYVTDLHIYHLAYMSHAEDAEKDVDELVDAIKAHIYADPTLGHVCYQAGEDTMGIRTRIFPSTVANEKLATYARVTFDTEVEIIA